VITSMNAWNRLGIAFRPVPKEKPPSAAESGIERR
jgi:hypothetical protein